jgi:hypothetical protein
MANYFQFHATASAASGMISLPFHEQIEAKAASTLSPGGGYGSSRALNIRHREILSIQEAYSYVTGSETPTSFQTSVTSVVIGLNILDIITADRIVARLTSSKPKTDAEAAIIPLGSRFENLRIAGQPVAPADRLLTGLFSNLNTLGKIICNPADEPDLPELAGQQRELEAHLGPPVEQQSRRPTDERMEKFLHDGRHGRPTRDLGPNGALTTSLVPDLRGAMPGFDSVRQIVPVTQFGLVRLAEFRVSNDQRRLTMLSVNLGCPFEGSLDLCYVESNGSIWA